VVKHRQLVRQVGVRIEDPPANSMASFKFTIDAMKPKILAASFHSDLDEFVDNLDDLPTHGSEDLRSRSRSGLRNSATELQEATNSESLSALEKDLDYLLQIGKPEAIARRGAAGCLGDNGLMITSTPKGRFVHWKGMKLSDLLEDEDRLVAHLEPLPFQEGKPLATMAEESTELVEASSDKLISRQVLMAEEGEDDGISPNDALDMISEDEATTNAGDENDNEREARRAKNRARAVRRRRVNERMRFVHLELDAELAAVSERGCRTPVANIARVTAILECSNDPNLRQALRYAQRAWIQLDRQNPASAIGEEHVGESRS
jgi:hypothetical protein